MKSLRWRLMLLAVALVLTTSVATGFSMLWLFERFLERSIDSQLNVKIAEIVAAFRVENGRVEITRPLSDSRYTVPMGGAYWQIFENDTPILESRSVWDMSLAAGKARISRRHSYERVWPGGATIYAMLQDVRIFDGGKPRLFRFVVAIDHEEIDAINAGFMNDAVIAFAGVGAILLLGAWVQIAIGLRPLKQVADHVAAIRAGREKRLEGPFPLEVEPLAREFNSLLDRQMDSVRRSRERVGALAHGLKTPITILYGKAENLEGEGLIHYAAGLRAQLGTMNKHVTRELARARSHGAATGGEILTDARRSIDRLIALMVRMPRGRELDFINDAPEGLNLAMDSDDFGEIMGNLLDNARKFAARRVSISAVFKTDCTTIFVADDGPGITEEMRDCLMQRGERATDNVEGSGLGLSIVQDLLADYQTSLVFGSDCKFGLKLGFAIPARLNNSSRFPGYSLN